MLGEVLALTILILVFFRIIYSALRFFECIKILDRLDIRDSDSLQIRRGVFTQSILRSTRHSVDGAVVREIHGLTYRGQKIMCDVLFYLEPFNSLPEKSSLYQATEELRDFFKSCRTKTMFDRNCVSVCMPKNIDPRIIIDLRMSDKGEVFFRKWVKFTEDWNAFYDLFNEVIKSSLFYPNSSEDSEHVFFAS